MTCVDWWPPLTIRSFHGVVCAKQCCAKFITPTGNFPAAYDPNRKLKNLTGHFPTSDNINRHMLKRRRSTYQIFYVYFSITCRDFQCGWEKELVFSHHFLFFWVHTQIFYTKPSGKPFLDPLDPIWWEKIAFVVFMCETFIDGLDNTRQM